MIIKQLYRENAFVQKRIGELHIIRQPINIHALLVYSRRSEKNDDNHDMDSDKSDKNADVDDAEEKSADENGKDDETASVENDTKDENN